MAMEKPNLRLFAQLAPGVSQMAREIGVTRMTIYNILNQTKNTRPETIAAFNTYLKELFEQRLRLSRMISG